MKKCIDAAAGQRADISRGRGDALAFLKSYGAGFGEREEISRCRAVVKILSAKKFLKPRDILVTFEAEIEVAVKSFDGCRLIN